MKREKHFIDETSIIIVDNKTRNNNLYERVLIQKERNKNDEKKIELIENAFQKNQKKKLL